LVSKLRGYLVIAPLIVLATMVMGAVSTFASFLDPSGNRSHRIARLWSRMLIWISGMRVEAEGIEKIVPGRGYVIASNHLSLMDTPLVMAHIPLQFRFLAKKGLFRIPFIGGHLRRAGHVSIPRDDPRGSLKAMSETARIIQERGVSALVFPEGGRSDGLMREFREGAAYIAIKAGVPVIPVAICGTREILAMGSLLIRPGKVGLRIGDPIPTAGLTLQSRAALTASLRAQVAAMLEP
jgi:1-acyl-sn-glycerol-3-phosphate acyltransferase